MSKEPISILFVDDEAMLLRAIARSLVRASYEIITAEGPGEALQVLGRRPIDVMVTDCDMPEMGGHELAQIARRDHPETVRMMLTGAATLENALHAINTGEVSRFFTKPFEPEVFLDEMEAMRDRIERRRVQRAETKRASRREQLDLWLERQFPGARSFERNAAGEVVVDVPSLLTKMDDAHVAPLAWQLLRRE